jgi:hypothetical protein
MSRPFDYDWFTGPIFENQRNQARMRCTQKKFPDLTQDDLESNPDAKQFFSELEVRTIVYLRDGFSYEVKEMVDVGSRSMLTFECEPLDEQYRVGSFVVTLQFEEIVRVEVFAVHPTEKPEDTPVITGFRSGPMDAAPHREEIHEIREPRGDATGEPDKS